MKSDYEQRMANRIARYNELAEKNAKLSEQQAEQARKMASVIPLGQPILIGHHSEARDRNYRKKVQRMHEKSWESEEKSKHYERKAEIAESNDAISSDDPQALEKLKEKLKSMESNQAFMKAANKLLRNKKATEQERIDLLSAYNVNSKEVRDIVIGRKGFQHFKLSNNNAEINRVRKRIGFLEKLSKITSHEITVSAVRIFMNVEANRLQLFFPDKPEENIRRQLKHHGFRWSPREGAWQRQISNMATYYAKEIAKQVETTASDQTVTQPQSQTN